MPRAKTPPALIADDTSDAGAIYSAGNALLEIGENNKEVEAMARAVALQIGYELPADGVDPDLIQRDIRANMARSVQACFEVGKALTVLKAICGHGNFASRLEVLGLDGHVAARFMQAAKKFSKLPSTATLKAIGNQTKLFEMLVLEDEQIAEFELNGQIGELSLDDVATMSVKELRYAVRDLRQDKEAAERLLGEKDAKLNLFKKQLSKNLPDLQPDAVATQLLKVVHEAEATACAWVEGHLNKAIEAVVAHDGEHDTSHRAVLSGFIAQVEDAAYSLRIKFALPRTAEIDHDPLRPMSEKEKDQLMDNIGWHNVKADA